MSVLRDEQGRFARKISSKSPVKKLSPKKLPATRLPVKKLPAKKLPTKKLPAKKQPAKQLPAKRLPVKKLPAKKLPAKKLPAKKLPAKKLPAKQLPAKRLPAKRLPAKRLPAKRLPAKRLPAKRLPAKKLPAKKLPKRLLPKRKRQPPKLPKRRRKKPELPHLPERSRQAESLMQERLLALFDGIAAEGRGIAMSQLTFINADGTVDGELRLEGLPEEWRAPGAHTLIVEFLSRVFRYFEVFPVKPEMGGTFWISFGVRFGPQNESEIGELAELYKRHRGLFQIGTYPGPAWGLGAIQNVITDYKVGLRAMLESLMSKRGMPPTVILIRFIWTPDGSRPAHYQGEK